MAEYSILKYTIQPKCLNGSLVIPQSSESPQN